MADDGRDGEGPSFADKLAHDEKLCRRLREEGVDGPTYEYLMEDLAATCLGIFGAWVRSNRIFEESRRVGHGQIRKFALAREDQEDLVQQIFLDGHKVFVRAITDDRWDPAQRTLLSTYFVGACIGAFANIWRRHCTPRRHEIPVDPTDITSLHPRSAPPDRSADALLGAHHPNDTTKVIIFCRFKLDWTCAEIADRMDLSETSVRRIAREALDWLNNDNNNNNDKQRQTIGGTGDE
jgi:DNA-directed RNA polymerase specialized sigma24 family protein